MFMPAALRISAKYVRNAWLTAAAMALLGVGFAGLGGWLLRDAWTTRARLQEVWERGLEPLEGGVKGKETSKTFIFRTYHLTVTYRDQQGQQHEAQVEAETVGEAVDRSQPLQIRYDPTDFSRVSVSWLQRLTWGPWIWMGLCAAFVIGGLALAWTMLAKTAKQVASARACEAGFEEFAAEVVSLAQDTHNGAPTGNYTVKYRLPEEAQVHTANILKGQPVVGADRVLVLRALSTGGHVVPRASDLSPFALDPQEAAEVVARFAGQR